ncbi:uncharacterized protein LOC123880866 isoform X2 [Maniola jurtina]|uniref:uncharacterized protein LOC123880866 isoform X2 n=1 Tax=Maniola jurtina TaxID=191418 RepID=UPI001E68B698|nr:uncharacterized protein LOC123880866 isoform X2 [Maniola jurtina]
MNKMFSSIKSYFIWKSPKSIEIKQNTSSLLLMISLSILEDVFLWKKMWLSLLFFVCFNIIFMMCWYRQLNLLQLVIGFSIIIVCIDVFETWLKYKHRNTCLKRLASHDNEKIKAATSKINNWIWRQWIGFAYLRNNNHTKAFLLLQIIMSLIFFIGRYTSGYTLLYMSFTILFFSHKLIPPLIKGYKRVQQNAESEFELEGLIPDASDENLDLLTIEPDQQPLSDDRQSLDYWKPEEMALEDVSDSSSDNSSSLARNLSMEKMQTLTKDVEVTDSSEDEYIPEEQQPEHYQSSLEVQPSGTWSNAAFSVLSNIRGAVVNMVYTPQDEKKRKRMSSVDSSDGFEMIDKNEL